MTYTKIATRIGAVAVAATASVAGFGVPSAQAASHTTGKVIATSGLSERKAPTTHSTKTGAYNYGESVKLYCSVSGEGIGQSGLWYSTNSSGTRWVAANYINASGPVEDCPVADTGTAKGVTTAALLKGRDGPSTSTLVFATYPKGTTVKVICKVRSQNIDGNRLWYLLDNSYWVAARYVKNVEGGPASNRTPVYCR